MKRISRAVAAAVMGISITAQAQGSASAGRQIFMQNCVVCHGPEGKGDGPGAAGLNPKPANFSEPQRRATPEDTQVRIVTNGGASAKLSPIMPAFNETLTPQQVRDVVTFIRAAFQQPESAVKQASK
jgi:mono/diheme cytochrome c family protein